MARVNPYDIFGADPFGLGGLGAGTDDEVPAPRLPQVRLPGATGGTATRTAPSPAPAPDVPDSTPSALTGTLPSGVSPEQYFNSLIGSKPGTPQSLAELEPQLNSVGIRVLRDRSGNVKDKIQLPNGQIIDVVLSAGVGGAGWAWQPQGQSASGLASYFTDPTQQFLLGGVDARLAQIQSLLNNQPSLDQISGLVNQAVGQWAGPQVQPAAFQSAISALSRALGQPMPENAQLPQVTANLRERVGQLRAEPYSQGDEAALRAQAFDQLEQDRTQAKARVLEQLGAKGHAATSGTVARALQEVDQAFDKMRATNTNQMALSEMQLRETRGTAADQLEMALANLGGIDQQAKMAWQQQQLAAGQSAAGLEMAWQQEVQRRMAAAMQASGSLEALKEGQWAAQNALGNEAYQVSSDPYRMALSSLGAAGGVYGQQPTAGSILSQLGGLSGMQSNANLNSANAWSQGLSGLNSLLGLWMRLNENA